MFEPHNEDDVITAMMERGHPDPRECKTCCDWRGTLPAWHVDAVMAEWYAAKGRTPPTAAPTEADSVPSESITPAEGRGEENQ